MNSEDKLTKPEFLEVIPEIEGDTWVIAEAYSVLALEVMQHDPVLGAKAIAVRSACTDLAEYLSSRAESAETKKLDHQK